jgi:hypothetical protein
MTAPNRKDMFYASFDAGPPAGVSAPLCRVQALPPPRPQIPLSYRTSRIYNPFFNRYFPALKKKHIDVTSIIYCTVRQKKKNQKAKREEEEEKPS